MKPVTPSGKTRLLLSVAVLALAIGACTPVAKNHGYLPDQTVIDILEEGLITKREVRRMLGSPSTTGSFDGETWYYITSTIEDYVWRKPAVIGREIVAVKFDSETEIIAAVAHYGLEDGRIINFSTRKTPTKGRELSFLEQLFGNVGRISADQLTDPNKQ